MAGSCGAAGTSSGGSAQNVNSEASSRTNQRILKRSEYIIEIRRLRSNWVYVNFMII